MSHENESFTAVLKSARMISPRVRELTFIREDGQTLSYLAGQFITLHLPSADQILSRNYSIATPPQNTIEFQIAAVYVEGGRATRLLFAMEVGERIKTSGPHGRFVLRDESPARYLLIATNTGVTPYRAMLPELGRRIDEQGLRVKLLLGVRNREERIYGDDFLEFAEHHSGFEFLACYSREMPEVPAPYEFQGHVQDRLADLALDPGTDIVYLCGNPGMIDMTVSQLKETGFPLKNLRREKYISSRGSGSATA